MSNQLTYLACPYSHRDAAVREKRFQLANEAAAIMLAHGLVVFSPISHTHPIATQCGLGLGWETWERFDTAFIAVSKEVVVLTIPGWGDSRGIAAERTIANKLGVPVYFAALDELRAWKGPRATFLRMRPE